MTKIVSAAEAVRHIGDNSTVTYTGFSGFSSPDELLGALRQRFIATGTPRDLTIFKAASIGDSKTKGSNQIALEGLVHCIISSHVGLEPAMSALVENNKCLAYMMPLGTITELLRAAAMKKPGILTTTGLGTFVDPRLEGGKINTVTCQQGQDVATVMDIADTECLFYKTIPVDVVLLSATYADEDGNISFAKEAMVDVQFEAAAAAHNSGGIVIVQVEDIVKRGSLPPKTVRLHNFMVDYVVVAKPENHVQCYTYEGFHPEWTGAICKPLGSIDKLPLDDRKVCSRRATLELRPGFFINLGIGIPASIAAVAAEEGLSGQLTLSIESGVIGGVPLGGLGLGGAVNPEAMYRMSDILNIYDGGGLDMSVLGLAEVDAAGNINVSKFNGRVVGPGGFINISQHTKKLIFAGTFTACHLKTDYTDGCLHIISEGQSKKFKRQVEQITFSGEYARRNKQQIMIVTERAVLEMTADGWMVTEVAPGADLERDILANMEFAPLISPTLHEMDKRIFRDAPMGLTFG